MVDKRPIGYEPGKPYFLDKRPPKNPRFENVNPIVDTGKTLKNMEVISDNLVAKRKGEMFFRIKADTLVKLLKQENNTESIYNFNDKKDENDNNRLSDDRSVISQISNFTSISHAPDKIPIQDKSSYLLLDLRDREDFDNYHITEAINFAAPNIGRDKFTIEMYNYKNNTGKVIIIYSSDERNGIPSANLLWQKGYENVYLLSGGIEEFLNIYPDFVEGKKIPASPPKLYINDNYDRILNSYPFYEALNPKKVLVRSNHKEKNDSESEKIINLETKDFTLLEEQSNFGRESVKSHVSIKTQKTEKSQKLKKPTSSSVLGFGSSSKKI